MEMGTGKTKVFLDEMCEMFENGDADSALILAPKGVYRNWDVIEMPVHMPNSILANTRILAWNSGGKDYNDRLRALCKTDKYAIFIMNVEALSAGTRGYDAAEEFMNAHQSTIICVDESTFIKNPSARRTKKVVELGRSAKWRRIMTGSPVTRSPLDLYSQFDFLGQKMLGFSSFYSFRARYAIMKEQRFGGRKVQLVVGYREIEDLTKRISPHSFRVRKDECLDLPAKIYTSRDVELTGEQRRLYDEFRKNATVALAEDEGHITATEVIVQILRLQQILCGHVKDELGAEHDLPSNRVDTLMEVVEEAGGKVIIWCRFRRDIENVTAALEKEYGAESVVQYYGDVESKDRGTAVHRFQNDETCRFFVGNPQTGGYGITLTAASTVVYYSNSYDLEQRMQSEDRAHRSGQTKSVTYVDLVCRGTVEEKIVAALRKKIDIAATIMGDGYRTWLV
jgi:SNF2 family DNA or RNA helicase